MTGPVASALSYQWRCDYLWKWRLGNIEVSAGESYTLSVLQVSDSGMFILYQFLFSVAAYGLLILHI
jgi:hypothetical protein